MRPEAPTKPANLIQLAKNAKENLLFTQEAIRANIDRRENAFQPIALGKLPFPLTLPNNDIKILQPSKEKTRFYDRIIDTPVPASLTIALSSLKEDYRHGFSPEVLMTDIPSKFAININYETQELLIPETFAPYLETYPLKGKMLLAHELQHINQAVIFSVITAASRVYLQMRKLPYEDDNIPVTRSAFFEKAMDVLQGAIGHTQSLLELDADKAPIIIAGHSVMREAITDVLSEVYNFLEQNNFLKHTGIVIESEPTMLQLASMMLELNRNTIEKYPLNRSADSECMRLFQLEQKRFSLATSSSS